MKKITEEETKRFSSAFETDPSRTVLRNVLAKGNIKDIVLNPDGMRNAHFNFSTEVKTLPVTNQLQSGRCWIFSALNILREEVAKKCEMKDFELSQNYVAFWDKYEKINYFMNTVSDLLSDSEDGPEKNERLLTYLLDTGIQDGGQWDMFVNIVEKYGVVPKSAMEETFQSSHTAFMNRIITRHLRDFAFRAKAIIKEAGNDIEARDARLSDLRDSKLESLYLFLAECFGMPPQSFDFEYTDKDDNYHIDPDMTPKSFYDKYVGLRLSEDYVSIVNSPTEDKPFYENITIDHLGNVIEAKPVQYLNLPMDELKNLIIKQLESGSTVWFGSDVSLEGDRDKGIWSRECFDYEKAFGLSLMMTKEDKLNFREAAMNHAMVITGVNIKDGSPTRWKIENSWGKDHGKKGFYLMDAGWFDEYVFQAVVRKDLLSDKQRDALSKEPLHFMPWDPMGTLAD